MFQAEEKRTERGNESERGEVYFEIQSKSKRLSAKFLSVSLKQSKAERREKKKKRNKNIA